MVVFVDCFTLKAVSIELQSRRFRILFRGVQGSGKSLLSIVHLDYIVKHIGTFVGKAVV